MILSKRGFEKTIEDVEEKIPNISWLVKMTDYNSKITEIKSNCSRNQV